MVSAPLVVRKRQWGNSFQGCAQLGFLALELLLALFQHLLLGLVRHEVTAAAAAARGALEVHVGTPDDDDDGERYDEQGEYGLGGHGKCRMVRQYSTPLWAGCNRAYPSPKSEPSWKTSRAAT